MEITSLNNNRGDEVLDTTFGLTSIDEICSRVIDHLATHYMITDCKLLGIDVGDGVLVTFRIGRGNYMIKYTSRDLSIRRGTVFSWISYLAEREVPVPEIVPTINGQWLAQVDGVQDGVYAYVMNVLPGELLAARNVTATINYGRAMAKWHQLGDQYEPRVIGDYEPLGERINRRTAVYVSELYRAPRMPPSGVRLVRDVGDELQRSVTFHLFDNLPQTHIHGEFHLGHVLFDLYDDVRGIVGIESAVYGERLLDICAGLVSHPGRADAVMFNADYINVCLESYQDILELSERERGALRPGLLYHMLERLWTMVQLPDAATDRLEAILQRMDDIDRIIV